VSATRTKLRLRVVPGASRAGIVGRYGAAWKVRITAAPEAGKANDAVLELLARTLDIPRRNLAIETGATSRDKIVSLTGLGEEAVEARLEQAGAAG
jgi:uncharacterized protein (TIGR00251 family)